MGGGTRPTRVSFNVAVCGNKEIHVNAVSEVAQLVKLVDGDVLQVGHLKSKEDQEVNSENYGGHFNVHLEHVSGQEGALESLHL